MASLTEQEVYELAIYLIELNNAVIGGENGIANLQAKQLANRTAWLKANKQDKDATLTALAAVVTVADKMIYATGSDTFSTTTLTAFARTLLDDVDAAAMRATLGAQPAGSYQASDATLTALAALVTAADKMIYSTGADAFSTTTLTAFARTLLDDVDAAAMRATLGAVSQTDINNAITALVNSSPAALDTLKELATALGNDANFATTMTNALANKQDKDATLTALAAVVTAADNGSAYFNSDLSYGKTKYASDLNLITGPAGAFLSGEFNIQESSLNRPFNYGIVQQYAVNPGECIQVARDLFSNRLLVREFRFSTWTGWGYPNVDMSMGNSGIKFLDGNIQKWGKTVPLAVGGVNNVVFPIAFPNACVFAIVIGTVWGAQAEGNHTVIAQSAASFSFVAGGAQTQEYFWFAIGN